MKNKEVISGVVGASFFALGYIGLSIAALPSLAIGAGAYVASELVLNGKKGENVVDNIEEISLKNKIKEAYKQNKHINDMINEIENVDVKNDMKDIVDTSSKILKTIEKNNLDNRTTNKFLDYYLPVCVSIIDRYDEIENQDLTSSDSKKFMNNSSKMIEETKKAFKNILNGLYEKDIYNNEAEMKVYNQMLKQDGYNSNEIDVKDGDSDE